MVLEIDFDNMSKYKSCYIAENVDIDNYDVIDLFVMKSMIRTPSGYLNMMVNPNLHETIYLRIFIYALIDYYTITKNSNINFVKFKLYVSQKKVYSRYMPLIYMYWQLAIETNQEYKASDINNIMLEELMKSNLHQFSERYTFDFTNYKKSYLYVNRIKINMEKLVRAMDLLNNFLFTTYDIFDNSGKKIEEEKVMSNKKTIRMMKLNRNFFRLRERIVNDNWLI